MIINRKENCTEYICSICGHKHIEYADGRKAYEPFIPYNRKIIQNKPVEKETYCGKRTLPELVGEYDGYTCPKCNKLQINVLDLYSKNN